MKCFHLWLEQWTAYPKPLYDLNYFVMMLELVKVQRYKNHSILDLALPLVLKNVTVKVNRSTPSNNDQHTNAVIEVFSLFIFSCQMFTVKNIIHIKKHYHTCNWNFWIFISLHEKMHGRKMNAGFWLSRT